MEPATPEAVPQIPNSNHKIQSGHGVTILAVALFVLASLTLIAFLYYQNQTLKKMLANSQPINQSTPQPTTPSPDPTASWKTYTDTKNGFSFKYPPDWTQTGVAGRFDDPTSKFIFSITIHKSSLTVKEWIESKECITKINPDQPTGGCTESVPGPIPESLQYTFVAHYGGMHTFVKNEGTIFDIALDAREPNPNFSEIKNTYNQILSTFRFFGTSPSLEPKACTQEAKLCPDGSYVGRTGPNCEFAPCP